MSLMDGERMTLERDGLGVELEFIGEGRTGDYDPSEPEDVPLARFGFYPAGVSDEEKEDAWDGQFRDTSYCCQIEADSPVEELQAALEYLWRMALPAFQAGLPLKRVAEMLSWADGDDVRLDRVPRPISALWLALSKAGSIDAEVKS